MPGSRCLTFLPILLILASACAPDPGKLSLSLDWGVLKPVNTVYLWLRVEERPNPDEAGVTLSSAGPKPYAPESPLTVPLDVPHGTDRVVIVEVRDSSSSSQPIILYGISEPFDFHAGDDVTVEVPIKITKSETTSVDLELSLVGAEQAVLATFPIPDSPFSPISLEQLRNVSFRARLAGAVGIILSQTSAFSEAVLYEMDDSDSSMNCEPVPDDDMNRQDCEVQGLDLSGGAENPPDGPYTLFVKLLDRYGYESPVYELTVILDSRAPTPELASLSPTSIKAGDSALLTVTFAEGLQDFPENPGLLAEPGKGLTFEPGQQIGQSNTYRWVFTATSDPGVAKPYTFKVQAKDLVGNQTEYEDVKDKDGILLELTVDATAPRISDPETVSYPKLFGPGALASGNGLLTFEFVITEDNPVDLDEADCPGCPEVRVGGNLLGSVALSPNYDGSSGQHAFVYTYQVSALDFVSLEGAGLDIQADLSVRWADAAGNPMEELLPDPVRFDFKSPLATFCQLAPGKGTPESQFVYTVTFTEEVADPAPPVLFPDGEMPGFSEASSDSGDGLTHQWQTAGSNLPVGPFSVQLEGITDLQGNVASKALCEASAEVDPSNPTVDSLLVQSTPQIFDSEGMKLLVLNGGTKLQLTLTATDDDGLAEDYPKVALSVAGKDKPLSLDDGSPGESQTFILDIPEDGGDLADGSWPLQIRLLDLAGNEAVVTDVSFYDADLVTDLVTLDFTAPTADCTLSHSDAKLNDVVQVQVQTNEPLQGNAPQIPANLQGVWKLIEPPPNATLFTFTRTVQEGDDATEWDFALSLQDVAGNTTEETCELKIGVDSKPPLLDSFALTIEDVVIGVDENPMLATSGSQTIWAKFTAIEAQELASLSTVVKLEVPGIPILFEPDPEGGDEVMNGCKKKEDGTYGCSARLRLKDEFEEVELQTLEGSWPVSVFLEDEKGNLTSVAQAGGKLVTVDATPPDAQCTIIPDLGDSGAPLGQEVVLQVSPFEALLQPGEGDILTPGPELEVKIGEVSYSNFFIEVLDTKSNYRFSHTVQEGDGEAEYTAKVTLTDLVGNVNDDACKGNAIIKVDAVAPSAELVDLALPGDTPFAAETPLAKSTVLYAAIETEGSDLPPTVAIGGGSMALSMDPPGDIFACVAAEPPCWVLERTLDGTELQGKVDLSVELSDAAGNPFSTSADEVATFDFAAPQIASSSLLLTAPAKSKVQSVAHITNGTTVQVLLTANETLAAAPTVTASRSGEELQFVADDGEKEAQQTTYLLKLGPVAGLSSADELQGEWTLTAKFKDVAGNGQEETLSPSHVFYVDTQVPATMSLDFQPGLRLYRNPWGSLESNYLPEIEVRGCGDPLVGVNEWEFCPDGGAFPETSAHVVLYKPQFKDGVAGCAEDVVTVTAGQLGDGSYGIPLWFDLPAICISQVDEAGNESTPFPIDTVEWVATLNGKVAGDTTANPHTLYEHDVHGKEGLVRLATQGFEVLDQEVLDGAGKAGDEKVAANQLHPGWRHHAWNQVEHPPTDEGTGEVHTWMDPLRGNVQTVHPSVFQLPQVMEWNGTNFVKTASQAFPPAASHIGLAYDWDNHETILFGGTKGDEGLSEGTWRYDGANWFNESLEVQPAPRAAPALAYDPARRKVILFGGANDKYMDEFDLNDTWLWDGESWEELSPMVIPPPVQMPRLHYEPAGNRLLLFGIDADFGDPGPVLVYEWTGDDWLEIESEGADEVEVDSGMDSSEASWTVSWESNRDRFVIFSAGTDEFYSWSNGVWTAEEWDYGDFELSSVRGAIHSAFDNSMVVLKDTSVMVWQEDNWSEFFDWDRGPRAPGRHALSYFPEDGTVVGHLSYHRYTNGYKEFVGSTWEWDGHTLHHEWSAEYPDPPGGNLTLAYDGVSGVMHYVSVHGEAVGCIQWVFDGESWNELPAIEGAPTQEGTSGLQGFVWDAQRDFSVLVRDELTWIWDGEVWHRFEGLEGIPARPVAATYDPERGVMIVADRGSYGGPKTGVGTYEFDGLNWTFLDAGIPSNEVDFLPDAIDAVFDRARGVAVHLGAKGDGAYSLREFDGQQWLEVDPAVAFKEGKRRPSVAYHEPGMALIALGGEPGDEGGTDYPAGPHLYAPAHARPHLVAAFDLAGGQALPTHLLFEAGVLESIGVTVLAGGTSHTLGTGRQDGELVEGYEMKGFLRTPDPWYSLGIVEGATPETPASRTREMGAEFDCEGHTYCQAATLDRWVAPDGKLYLDIAPIEAWGATPEKPVIALDYVEVRLVYSTGQQCIPGSECCTGQGRYDEGAFCTDDDPCTTGTACYRGQCGRPAGTSCQAGESRCHLGALQDCSEVTPVPGEASCWIFVTSDDCNDDNPCTADSCGDGLGCQHTAPVHQCQLGTTACLVNQIRTCVDVVDGLDECRMWGEAEECPDYSKCQGEVEAAACECVDNSCQGNCCPYDSLLGLYGCDGETCILQP